MNDDIFNIDPEGLEEKGREILTEEKTIRDALQDISDAKKLLDGWQSSNKEKFESKVNMILPKINEMNEALRLYGEIAVKAAERVKASENLIANRIENDLQG